LLAQTNAEKNWTFRQRMLETKKIAGKELSNTIEMILGDSKHAFEDNSLTR
jgi:hypothetical protein